MNPDVVSITKADPYMDIPKPEDIKGNPSLRFAMTQLSSAASLKESAKGLMAEIEEVQAKQKDAGVMLDKFRRYQSDTSNKSPATITITAEEHRWCVDHGIELPGKVAQNNYNFNATEWDLICKGVQAYSDRLGTDTQQKMVNVQDALGQSNARTQGASSSVSASNESLKYIAKGQ